MSHCTSGHTPEDLQRAHLILEELKDELHDQLLLTDPEAADENCLARDCRDVNSLWNRLSIAAYPPPLGGRIDGEPTPLSFLLRAGCSGSHDPVSRLVTHRRADGATKA
jgi:hypothetical protein